MGICRGNMNKIVFILLLYSTALCHKIGVGTLDISAKAKKYVLQVLNSNRLSYGPFLKKFEKQFAHLHGARFGIASNSGTSSLQVALQTLKELHDWQDGDEVIVPSVTFVATANIIIHNQMKPIFIDIEPNYYGINPELIEEKITDKTKAIIVAHLFGQPCNMNPILELAKKYNLKIIEDSCETMFAKYNGKIVGSIGDIGCFSTYVAHLLTTGVGGLSITNNPLYAIKMRSLVNHGRDNIYINIDDDKNLSSGKMHELIKKRFSFTSVGHSFRLTELEGALGLAQLENWHDMIAKRRNNAKFLIERLACLKHKIQLPQIRKNSEHSFMMFPIVLQNTHKKPLVEYLEDKGIETRDMLPLVNQPIYKKLYNTVPQNYPVAYWINNSGFYIGCHQNLSQDDLEFIVDTLTNYFNKLE